MAVLQKLTKKEKPNERDIAIPISAVHFWS